VKGLSRFNAARAILRLAWREAWRNGRRSSLIAVMIALPVLAAGTVSVVYRSDQKDPQDVARVRLGEQGQALITGRSAGQPIVQTPTGLSQVSDRRSSIRGVTPLWTLEDEVAHAGPLLPGDQLIPRWSRYFNHELELGDRALSGEVQEFDYTRPGAQGLVEQLSGRPPRGRGEVVVSRTMADDDGIKLGDQLRLTPSQQPSSTLRVVGFVGGISLVGHRVMIGQPGQVLPADNAPDSGATLLVVGPHAVGWNQIQQLNRLGLAVTSRAVLQDPPSTGQVPYYRLQYGRPPNTIAKYGLSAGTALGVGIVAVGLILLQIALLAGPAIAVGARRNERTLALITAAGGEPRHSRGMVLATSGVIGLVAATAGAVFGAGFGVLAVPWLREHRDQQLVRADVHLLDLSVLVLVGTLTAVAAAAIPAQRASRLNAVALLAGRRGLVRPRRSVVPLLGLLIIVIGALVCCYDGTRRHPFVMVVAIAATESGLIMMIGTVIAFAARAAGRLPFAGRFALRDAARQRRRTAPAVAAVMAAVSGSVAVGVYFTSQNASNETAYRPRTAVGLVTVSLDGQSAERRAGPNPSGTDLALAAALRKSLPVASAIPYQQLGWDHALGRGGALDFSLNLLTPPNGYPPPDPRPARLYRPLLNSPSYGLGYGLGNLVDDGSALEKITGVKDPVARAGLAAGKVLVFQPQQLWPDGTVHVEVVRSPRTHHTAVLPGQLITSRPGFLGAVFPRSAAAVLGMAVLDGGVLAGTTQVPTQLQEERAAVEVQAVAPASLFVERGFPGRYALVLLVLLIAAAVVTLGGTAAAVALAAAESRADVSTLAAVGASPGTRRRLAAAQGAVISGLGTALGLITGLLAGWALIRLQLRPEPAVFGEAVLDRWNAPGIPQVFAVPWRQVLVLVLGVPTAATLLAFLTTRSALPTLRRPDR
jgi:putative ABC transport system permease protein